MDRDIRYSYSSKIKQLILFFIVQVTTIIALWFTVINNIISPTAFFYGLIALTVLIFIAALVSDILSRKKSSI